MSLPYTSPSFAALYQTGQPDISHPIPQDPDHAFLRVSFECAAANYAPGALDDTYLFNAVTYYLIRPDEGVWRDGALLRFSRTYANLPSARNEYQSYEYYFPAFVGENTGTFYLRYPYRKVVSSRLAYAYFHTTTPATSISIFAAFQIQQNTSPASSYNYVNYLMDAAGTFYGTSPSYAGYLASIVGTEIVAETTTWKRYQGNFWEAVTRYVTAE